MAYAYIGIGSNLGNKNTNIKKSIKLLKEKCEVTKISSLYETEPIGYKAQDYFLNCVVKIRTNFNPEQLLKFLQSIENKLKRVREIKNGPRTIDLDILFYGNDIVNANNLIIPHPRLHERRFALVPLNEIAPEFVHPLLKRKVNSILKNLNSKDIVKLYKKSKELSLQA